MQEQKKTPPYCQEASPMWHFFAFFVTGKVSSSYFQQLCTNPTLPAGTFASLVSHIVNARFRFPRLVKQLSAHTSASASESTKTHTATMSRRRFFTMKKSLDSDSAGEQTKKAMGTIVPSLGASGAIYACVVLTALAYPTAQVTLVFPPTFPLPITWAVGGTICLDVLGIIKGWRCVILYYITAYYL